MLCDLAANGDCCVWISQALSLAAEDHPERESIVALQAKCELRHRTAQQVTQATEQANAKDYAAALTTLDAVLEAEQKFPGRANARELREDCARTRPSHIDVVSAAATCLGESTGIEPYMTH
eukprot:COSAG05_NODE_1083_length_5933_cov_3.284196_6_plen_122_part_00